MGRAATSLLLASSWRRWGWPRLLPINVTISATFRCNFRCATCNVYERKVTELRVEDWDRVFRSMGRAPTWITFSGGEPFMKTPLPDIVLSAAEHCHPAVVNIPSNGWYSDRIVAGVERIARKAPEVELVVNLSLDHHQPTRHDDIRGAPGSWERMMETYGRLRDLDLPNLTLGIHTVVSSENEDDFPAIPHGLRELGADSYIAEPAEERVELGTVGADIAPADTAFARAADAVLEVDGEQARGLVARAALAIRGEYYRRVSRFLAGDDGAMPVCHAGFLSCQIGSGGEVWSCCVLSRRLGHLRETDLDFRRVWFSEEAESFRDWMRSTRCACPLANAAYTNLMVEPAAVGRIANAFVRRPRVVSSTSTGTTDGQP